VVRTGPMGSCHAASLWSHVIMLVSFSSLFFLYA
jgi:hypothetical protein